MYPKYLFSNKSSHVLQWFNTCINLYDVLWIMYDLITLLSHIKYRKAVAYDVNFVASIEIVVFSRAARMKVWKSIKNSCILLFSTILVCDACDQIEFQLYFGYPCHVLTIHVLTIHGWGQSFLRCIFPLRKSPKSHAGEPSTKLHIDCLGQNRLQSFDFHSTVCSSSKPKRSAWSNGGR